MESIDFHLFHSIVLQAVIVTEREKSKNFPGPAEWSDRLLHHFMWQWHYLGALRTLVTLDYVLALEGGGFSQSYTNLFGGLYETKYYRALCQQEPHKHSYNLQPNYIYLERFVHFRAAGALCTGRGGVRPGWERTWLWG